ncbi:MAG: protein kinase, partial [Gemmatimonadota bacterium]
RVALKVLRPELAGSLATDRFLREIRISAGLQHPHILQLLDSGQADGLPFCVLPDVEGETLREKLEREQQLDIDEVVRIVQEVSDALDHAHEKEVIHRDIKPSNIFLSGDHTFVGDFGVAKALSVAGGERLTQSGFAIGTPSYMSPEQATGEAHLDRRSDVYSLGCMTFEMLAGEPPFSGPTGAAIIAKQASQDAPPLRVVRPRVPWGIEQAVEKALAKVPADRFSTAARFAQALSAGRETQNPPQWIVRVADAIRRRWAFSAALGYAVLVALGWVALQRLEGFGVVTEPLLADLTVSLFSLIPLVAAVGWVLDPGIRRGASAAGGEGPESFRRLHRFVRWRGGPLLLSGLVSACFMVILWPDEAVIPTPADGPLSSSIAILYFQTPQGEEDLRSFASLLTEELIGKFSDIQEAAGLTVSSKGAVEESLLRNRPGIETARAVGADYLIDGSVIRSGDSVVVKFHLESPETEQILWRSEVKERYASAWELPLIQKVADDLAEQLRRRVGVEIRERETGLETDNRFAFKAFMGANEQFFYAKRLVFQGQSGDVISEFGKAENGYREAIGLDPQWSAPYVRIGEIAGWKVIFFTEMMDPSDLTAALEAIDEGIELLDLALKNDPDDPRVLAQKGELLFRRGSNIPDPVEARAALTEAIENLEAAVENDSNMASALGTLSLIHLERGQYRQAKLRGERALVKDAFLEDATKVTGTL